MVYVFLYDKELFSEIICGEVLENFVILFAIWLPIKSPVTSAIVWNYSFWKIFKCIFCRLLSGIKKFLTVFTPYDSIYILPIFLPIILAKDKNPQSFTNIRSLE